jgi:hypothetical protein
MHIHHVLIDRGINPRLAVTVLYGVCGLFGLFSLLFMNPSGRTLGFALASLGVCIWFGIQQLAYPELRELNGYLARGIQYQRRLITGNVLVGRMLDGFRKARKLSDVLDSLADLLHEMEFTRAEVRLPSLHQNKVVLRTRSWSALCDGRTHCLYRWHKAGEKRVRPRRGTAKFEDSDTPGIGHDFRLEFVFRVNLPEAMAAPSPKPSAAPPRGVDIGRLTFFHPADTEYPLSALCLLGRNVWREFGDAITRVMALPNAGLADRSTSAYAPLDAPVEPQREVEVWTGFPARTGS